MQYITVTYYCLKEQYSNNIAFFDLMVKIIFTTNSQTTISCKIDNLHQICLCNTTDHCWCTLQRSFIEISIDEWTFIQKIQKVI